MKTAIIVIAAFVFLLSISSPAVTANDVSSGNSKEYRSIENQKTGLTWRFYHNVKGNRKLPHGFCLDPANDGGNNWRLPIRKEFEILIADPEFKFPPELPAEYYSREVRDTFGHATTPKKLLSNMDLGPVYVENSDALVFDVARNKWNWRFVTNEYGVACVSPTN